MQRVYLGGKERKRQVLVESGHLGGWKDLNGKKQKPQGKGIAEALGART